IMEKVRTLLADYVSGKSVTFHITVPSPSPRLFVDEHKFVQILINILSNAFKFTPDGGAVSLLAHIRDDGVLEIAVRDTGIGIAKKDIETLFSPFGQVESAFTRRQHGTGLGLPLTNSLVQMHGGSLSLESEVGKGTTVTVILPASRVQTTAGAIIKLLA